LTVQTRAHIPVAASLSERNPLKRRRRIKKSKKIEKEKKKQITSHFTDTVIVS
jgi:hypothetical protein